MMTPQLKKLIDDINNRHRVNISYNYGDGKSAHLSANKETITITTDNPELAVVLRKILEKILSGDVKGIIDKKR